MRRMRPTCRIDKVMDNEATEKTAIIGRSRRYGQLCGGW